jgi:hypothetical protein
MRRITLPILIAAALLLGGCVFSVSPLYTAKDLVYDPALVGVWAKDEKDATTWTFEKAGESGYKLVVVQGQTSSPFVAHLVQLGEHRFMDLCPDKSALEELKLMDLYKAGLIRGHLFLKVLQIKPALQMKVMDDGWLGKLLNRDPVALAHEETEEDGLVLTAPTKALQAFMVQHWNTAGAWGDESSDLKRR